MREISICARVKIINLLILSKFIYSSLIFDIPAEMILKVYKKIANQILGKNIPEIERGILFQAIEGGGLNLQYITYKAMTKRTPFFQKLERNEQNQEHGLTEKLANIC